MPREILQEFGIDPSLALTPEERQRAKNRDPLADLSPAERFRYRALQSLSLGFFRPQMPEAATFGGKAAEFAGTIAGSIPAVIASTATGGAPLAGLAGRAGAGALGQFIARELGTGLAFEAMNLPSRFWHGDDPRSIASEAAKGVGLGVGISLAGRALGRGLQTLTRRGRGTAASEAIRTPSPGPETPPGPPASQVAGEMAAINKYIDDLRAFYKERPYLISRDWSRYVDESTRELRQALDAIRPEFEKRLKARSLAPTTVQGMREWLRRRLGGNVPKGFNRMKKADLQRWVRTLETGAEVSPATIMQEVARDMGIDLRGIIEAVPHIPDPASPDDILEFLLAREREAVLRGKAIPRVYFDEAHGNVSTPPEQDFVQAVAAGRKNAQTPTMETLTQSPDPELREMSRRIIEDESVVRQAVQDPPKK